MRPAIQWFDRPFVGFDRGPGPFSGYQPTPWGGNPSQTVASYQTAGVGQFVTMTVRWARRDVTSATIHPTTIHTGNQVDDRRRSIWDVADGNDGLRQHVAAVRIATTTATTLVVHDASRFPRTSLTHDLKPTAAVDVGADLRQHLGPVTRSCQLRPWPEAVSAATRPPAADLVRSPRSGGPTPQRSTGTTPPTSRLQQPGQEGRGRPHAGSLPPSPNTSTTAAGIAAVEVAGT